MDHVLDRGLLGLEVAVDARLASIREPVLVLVVAVAKVVAVASRGEGEAERVVRRRAATVRVPDQGGRVASIAVDSEGGEGNAEEILVCDLVGGLPLDKACHNHGRSRQGQD